MNPVQLVTEQTANLIGNSASGCPALALSDIAITVKPT